MRLLLSFGEVWRVLVIGFICALIIIGIFAMTNILENLLWAFVFILLVVAVILIVIERFSGWT